MKRLFDQNISHRIIKEVTGDFEGSAQVGHLGLENASDREIWDYAKKNEFVIVTFDSDFFDFSMIWGHPPKIIRIKSIKQPEEFKTY